MKFGRILGQVIATQKTGKVEGLKLLVVQPLTEELAPDGKAIACVDTVQAKADDLVLLCGSSSARLTSLTKGVCVDTTITAMVDQITMGGRTATGRVKEGGKGKSRK